MTIKAGIELIGGQLDGESCTEKAFDTGGYFMYTYGPSATNPYEEDGESIYKLHTDGKAYCVRDTKHFVVIPPKAAPTTIDFSKALLAMKAGECVYREGWNGKGMFCYYVPANKYPASGNTMATMEGVYEDDMVPYEGYAAMKTARGTVIPWICSQSDMFASDWVVVK